MFIGEDRTPSTILAGYAGLAKAIFANGVPCKCTSHGHAERALAHNVLTTDHQKEILQSDQEPSIIDVKHKASTHLPTEIVYDKSHVGDSNADGSIERAIQTIQGHTRVIKDFPEYHAAGREHVLQARGQQSAGRGAQHHHEDRAARDPNAREGRVCSKL